MGVVYRLTPEISAFIISEKQKDPKATCQYLSGRVFLQFGQQVSKSSVHALLKQAQVITPRERKIKDTFKIPLSKKAEISKALAPFIEKPPVLIQEQPSKPAVAEMSLSLQEEPVPEQGQEAEEIKPAMGRIFLNAALWDLSFKAISGIKDVSEIANFNDSQIREDWAYLTQQMLAVKIETEAGVLYLDPRFQGLYGSVPQFEHLAVPVEHAIGQVTDQILNNIEPVVIRLEAVQDLIPTFYHFLDAFENCPGKTIKRIALIGTKQREFIDFKHPLAMKRRFILGVSTEHQELQWFANETSEELPWPQKELGIKIIRNDNNFIVTNILTMSCNEIRDIYKEKHPHRCLAGVRKMIESPDQEEQWLDLWLETKLKSRIKMFLSNEIDSVALEGILQLSGREVIEGNKRSVFLQVPEESTYKEEIGQLIENINGCDIKDFMARKLKIYVEH